MSTAITAKTIQATHSLQGTVYLRHDDGTYYYHCHALPNGAPAVADTIWQVWREHKVDGHITCPTVGGNAAPGFEHAVDNVTGLTYLAPGVPA